MAITALPTPPQRSDPTNFAARADDFMTALPTFATEANALATAVNTSASNAATSETNAAASASAASGSATTASGHASNASTQASNAAASAVTAATQASNASTSASAAAASAAAAAASAVTNTSTNTFSNKSISLGSNTVSGTKAQFNTAMTDADFATLDGTETLTNKTIALGSNTVSGTKAQFNAAMSDADFATLDGTETLTNKTIALGSNTVSGTKAQFNAAMSDADFATLDGTETLTNKTLTMPILGAATVTSLNGGQLGGFRNRIINGAMLIDQRNAGASITPTANSYPYSVDRWQVGGNVSGKLSFQQSTTAPTGFKNSMLITSLSAYSMASNEICIMRQHVEGYNVVDLAFGTASAKTVTVSFWARSSLTGAFGVLLQESGGSYTYPALYTINSANTWEYKSVAISGSTGGTWQTGSSSSIDVIFDLGTGSSFKGTANAWVTGSTPYGTTGGQNLVATNGATLYITGVQLEIGSTATPFEQRPIGTELALCQRYYEKSYNQSVAPGTATSGSIFAGSISGTVMGGIVGAYAYKVTKRTTPTVTYYDAAGTAAKITTWSSGISTNGVSPTNGGWVSNETMDLVYHSSSVSGFQYMLTASAEL